MPPVEQATEARSGLRHAQAYEEQWRAVTGVTLLVAGGDPVPPALRRRLLLEEIHVITCADGAEALYRFGKHDPDVVLLAADLPAVPAPVVAATMRAGTEAPILVAASASEIELAGTALLAGATTLIRRPYESRELLGALRRLKRAIEVQRRGHGALAHGPLHLDPLSFQARLHGRDLGLPVKEFELLRLLMQHPGQVVTVEQIRDALWGHTGQLPRSDAVKVHVAKLRAHLGAAQLLVAVRGRGYRLDVPSQSMSSTPRAPG